jgi:hypothetical protein
MLPTAEKMPDLVPPCSDASGHDDVALDSFLWQQLATAALVAVAEKVSAGRDLELDEVLALSRASLPILAKIVQLRPAASGSFDMAPAALPIERVSSLAEPRFSGTRS